jgi:hypothetical protein
MMSGGLRCMHFKACHALKLLDYDRSSDLCRAGRGAVVCLLDAQYIQCIQNLRQLSLVALPKCDIWPTCSPSHASQVVEAELQRIPRALLRGHSQELWSIIYMPQILPKPDPNLNSNSYPNPNSNPDPDYNLDPDPDPDPESCCVSS